MDCPAPDSNLSKSASSIHPSVFIASGAVVQGKVSIDEHSSIWFNAVVRGDTEWIRIGRRTNIQDLCLLHADAGFPCELGNDVTVGHRAIVHGACVADNVMVGMGAILLNGSKIGERSVIAAGAVVTEGTEIPPGSLIMGMPARIRRAVNDNEVDRIRQAARHYVEMAKLWEQSRQSAPGDA